MYSFYDMLPYAQMGGGANAQQQQLMQIVQAYAQIAGVDPRQIMQQLQQMQPQQQQQALQQMMQAVEQGSGQTAEEETMQPQMKMGGAPCYECGGMYKSGGYLPKAQEGVPEWHSEWANDPELAEQFGYNDAPAKDNAKSSAKKINYGGPSIVDLLNSVGKSSDYSTRKKIAASLNISNYTGTASQNKTLIDLILNNPDILNNIETGKQSGSPAKTNKQVKKQNAPVPKQEDIWSIAQRVNPGDKRMMTAGQQQQQFKQWNGVLPSNAVQGVYSDDRVLNQIEKDRKAGRRVSSPGRTPAQQIFDQGMLNFFTEDAPLAVIPPAGGLVSWGTKYLPYGLKLLPEVVPAARQASRALPYATRALPYQIGGMIPELPIGAYDLPMYDDGSTASGYGQNMAMFGYGGGYMDPAWRKEGGIHIKPENRGKFTASANRAGMGVQEFARHVLANKEDYSSTQVKRANFARNASKWHHQDGGLTAGQEMDATPELLAWLDANGYTYEHI